MKYKKIITPLVSLPVAVALLGVFAVLPAQALTVGADASIKANARLEANTQERLPKIVARSSTAIDERIADLNKLNARVQEMKNVSASEKTTIATEVQTNITALIALKAQIAADTDVTVALNHEKSIRGSYRIYALIVPQGYIFATTDRIATVANLMTTMSAKIQARITAAGAAGKNVTSLQASLGSFNLKVADAKVQASAALAIVANLTPDQGNQTQMDANTAALKTARADIKLATADLKAAREIAKTILKGLKSL